MKPFQSAVLILLISSMFIYSCNEEQTASKQDSESRKDTTMSVSLKEESASFPLDTATSASYVIYDENKTGTRPVVLVIPEWWGLNEYIKTRSRQLAELGYLAMGVDIYGNGKTVDNPKDAGAASGPFYQDPQMTLKRIEAAIAKVKTFPQADTSQVAAIGYCFGGGVLLNSARLGLNVDGVVSFHGSLIGTPAKKELLKARIVVCHGAADPFVPEEQVTAFKESMDSINANYIFKAYPNAKHAFTNPQATETGKKFNIPIEYNAAADSASWNEMKTFFGELFTVRN